MCWGTLSYFFFTLKPPPVLTGASNFGKWVIMITFGAAFGNAILGRVSLSSVECSSCSESGYTSSSNSLWTKR